VVVFEEFFFKEFLRFVRYGELPAYIYCMVNYGNKFIFYFVAFNEFVDRGIF